MRILDLNGLLRENDYAPMEICVDGIYTKGVFWRCPISKRAFFLSNEPLYDGCKSAFESIDGYDYSWVSDGTAMNLKLFEIINKTFRSASTFRFSAWCEPEPRFVSWIENNGFGEADRSSTDMAMPDSFISDLYEQEVLYRGMYSYHYHHGEYQNKPMDDYDGYKIGVELEVEFGDNDDYRDMFTSATSNWFYRERDGSLGEGGVEIITVPLRPQDAKSIEFWKPLIDALRGKATSWDNGRCGLHVHIGREILGNRLREDVSEVIGKLLYFYHHCLKESPINTRIYGRSRGYHEADGKTEESRAVDILGTSLLKNRDVCDKVKNSMIRRSGDERYFDINLLNSSTIEFRKGRGSLDTTRIVAIIEWSEIILKYAKSTPWDSISYSDFIRFVKAISVQSTLIKNSIASL